MLDDFVILLLGCAAMVFLANWIVKRSIEIAEFLGISGTFIGMTVLAIGTSLPEIFTHIIGSLQIIKQPAFMNSVSALVLGSNVGSDIFQQNFILGIVAIIGAVYLVKEEMPTIVGGLAGGTVVLFIMCIDGRVSQFEGIVLVSGYLLYLSYLKKKEKQEEINASKKHHGKKHRDLQEEIRELVLASLVLLMAFIGMTIVSRQVLASAESLVSQLPISASLFGVIILGIAAAMPELTTSLIALKKKQVGMSAGVLLGSNVTNPMLAVGIGAIISTYTVPKVIIWYDLPVKILSCLLIMFFFLKYKKMEKHHGVILISMFLAYLILRTLFFHVDAF